MMETIITDDRRVLVSCSCGKQTTLTFTGEKYEANYLGWKFRNVAEADEFERNSGRHINAGWYCGEPDHEQRTP